MDRLDQDHGTPMSRQTPHLCAEPYCPNIVDGPRPAMSSTVDAYVSATPAATTPPTPLELGRNAPKLRAAGSIRRVAGESV
jgi:hypothetical protein